MLGKSALSREGEDQGFCLGSVCFLKYIVDIQMSMSDSFIDKSELRGLVSSRDTDLECRVM